MRKVALVFVLAVIAPSLVLAWLALGSLRDQEAVLERQRTLLYQGLADSVAAQVRAGVDALRGEFEAEVAELLRGADSKSLSAGFDARLRARWPAADVGFVVALDGDVLEPSMFAGPEARRFRVENDRFLCSRESVEVYWNSPKGAINLTRLDQGEPRSAAGAPSGAPSAEPSQKLKATRTVSPEKEKSANVAPGSPAAGASPSAAPSASSAGLAGNSASPAPSMETNLAAAGSALSVASSLAPEAAAFREIVKGGESGTLARFLQDELNVLFWSRPPLDRPLVFGARVNLARLVASVREALAVEPPLDREVVLALLNAAGKPVAVSRPGFDPRSSSGKNPSAAGPQQVALRFREEKNSIAPANAVYSAPAVRGDWSRPFVATEIGEMLPHWEVAAYLVDPGAPGRSAASARGVVGLLILVLVLAIAVGSWLIVQDLNRQLALARQKTDFVSNVSHELKTPLTSIRLFSEMLAEGRVTDEARRREFLGIITAETARLTRLINNVLDFARLERGERIYRLAPLDLAALARETTEAYRPQLEAAGFRLDARWGTEPIPVQGDRDALAQVMVNLLSNAEKYSGDAREIRVTLERVSAEQELSAGGGCTGSDGASGKGRAPGMGRGPSMMVEWSVLDAGRGVPPGCEEKIFEQFFRGHDSLSSGIQGSGLGLTLARQIAAAHGGTVLHRPRPGGGSCFTLRLPVDGGGANWEGNDTA